MAVLEKDPGDVLLSHTVTCAVPSTLEGLTTEFGMGSGVAPPPLPPGRWGVMVHPILTSSGELAGARNVREGA